MEESVGDLASSVIGEIQEKERERLEAGFIPETSEIIDIEGHPYRHLFEKIQYTWKYEDKNALTQLRAASERAFIDLFASSLKVVDDLYAQARIYEVNDAGQVIVDHEGRYVWKRDEHGEYIEDWKQLNGQDIEACLLDLLKIKMETSRRVSTLFLEAVFAKYSFDDDWREAYEKPIQGTDGIRTSRANREARPSKYHGFFRYWIWYRTNEFQKEVVAFMRLLERIRGWRIQESDKWHNA